MASRRQGESQPSRAISSITRFLRLISRSSSVIQIPYTAICQHYGSMSGGICNFTLGCGDGDYCNLFDQVSQGLGIGKLQGYHGIDMDEASIAEARKAYPGGDFQCGDITNGIRLRKAP